MDFEFKDKYSMDDLLTIVAMLRDKDKGCPWDKVQNHKTIRKNFIEETYEVIEAIDNDDKTNMQEELGDVLLQILLHSQFEAEENNFDFSGVANGIAQKLVLRHPHVFKGSVNKTVDGVLAKWEEIKKEEKGQSTASETIDAIPKSFPAMLYAQKLQKRAVAGGLERRTKLEILDALQTEIDEIKKSVEENQVAEKPIGELIYDTISLCGLLKYHAEEILEEKNKEKAQFFKVLDNLLLQSGMEFDTINNELFNKFIERTVKTLK